MNTMTNEKLLAKIASDRKKLNTNDQRSSLIRKIERDRAAMGWGKTTKPDEEPIKTSYGEYEDMITAEKQSRIDAFTTVPTSPIDKLNQKAAFNAIQRQKEYEELLAMDTEAAEKELEAAALIEKQTAYATEDDIFESKVPVREPTAYDPDSAINPFAQFLDGADKRYAAGGYQNDVVDSYEAGAKATREDVAGKVRNPTDILMPKPSTVFPNNGANEGRSNYLAGITDHTTANSAPSLFSVDIDDNAPQYVEKPKTDAQIAREEYYSNGMATYDGLSVEDRNLLYKYFWIKQVADNTDEISDGIIYERGDGKKIKISSSDYAALENDYNALIARLNAENAPEDIERMQNTLSAYANSVNRAQSDVLSAKYATMHPVMGSVLSIGGRVVGGIPATVDLIAQNASNIGKEDGYVKPIDYNTPISDALNQGNTLRGTVSENINTSAGDFASFFYDATMSIADNVVVGPLGKVASSAAIFGSAAYDSAKAAAERGAEDWRAIGTGLVSGVIELALENLSKIGTFSRLEDLQNIPIGSIDELLRSLVASGHLEGLEEGFTEILNKINEMIWSPSTSSAAVTFEEYKAQGLSPKEAILRTVGDISFDVLKAYGGGFIGGGEMQFVGGVGNYAANRGIAKANGGYFTDENGKLHEESYNALLTDAFSSKDENVLKYAKILGNLKDKVTPREAGLLYSMLASSRQGAANTETSVTETANRTSVRLEQSKAVTSDEMKEKTSSFKTALLDFFKKIASKNFQQGEKLYFENVSSRAASNIKKILGVDVFGWRTAIEARMADHILKRHGANGKQDHSMQNEKDIARIYDVLNSYDSIEYGGKTSAYSSNAPGGKHRQADTVLYEKRYDDGVIYVVEAVPDTNAKTLYVVTAYKKTEASETARANNVDLGETSKNENQNTSAINSISQPGGISQEDAYIEAARSELSKDAQAAFDIAMKGADDRAAAARQFEIYYLRGYLGRDIGIDVDAEITPVMQEAAYEYGAEAAKAVNKCYNQKAGTVFIEEGVVLSSMTRSLADTAAKNLGVPVSFVKTLGGTRGFYRTTTGEIVVSAEAVVKFKDGTELKGDEAARRIILGHELTHRLKAKGGTSYAAFEKFVLEHTANAENTIGKYMKSLSLDRDAALEELVCDYAMINLFSDAKLAKEITTKHSKIAEIIRDFFEWVKTKLGAGTKMYNEIDQAARLWNDAYNAASKNKNSVNENNGVKYSLKNYDSHQIENWANSKRIVIYKSDSQLLQFVKDSRSGKVTDKKMYFGAIPKDLAQDIKKVIGADVEGYNCTISSDDIRKVFKDHGDEAKEALRGQRAVTEEDFLYIPQVIESPDNIISAGLYNGKPAVKFIKTSDSKYTVTAVVSDKHMDLFVQTAYVGKKSKNLSTPTTEQAVANTPKANNGTVLTNSRIAQNPPTVNSQSMQNSENDASGTVKHSYGSIYAKTANASKLEEAQRMESVGVDSEAIRKATGWHKGYDGKWRFEISDAEMQISKNGYSKNAAKIAEYRALIDKFINDELTEEDIKRSKALRKALGGKRIWSILGDHVQHEKLFEAYPVLAVYPISFKKLPEYVGGYYNSRTREFTFDSRLDEAELKQTVLHEIQHAIQDIEELASGSNPNMFYLNPDRMYFYTAGEIEARDVSARGELTEAQRKNTRPDIDKTDVVFADDAISYAVLEDVQNGGDLTSDGVHYAKGNYSIEINNLAGEKPFSKNMKQALSNEYDSFKKQLGDIDTVKGVQNRKYMNNSVWGSYNDNSGTITMFNAGGDEGLAFMVRLAKQMKKDGKWSTSSPFHAYRHELAHAWLAYLAKNNSNYNSKMHEIEAIKKYILDGLTNISESDRLAKMANILSEYGITEDAELDDFICECVAEYTNGNPRHTAKIVVEILLKKE